MMRKGGEVFELTEGLILDQVFAYLKFVPDDWTIDLTLYIGNGKGNICLIRT